MFPHKPAHLELDRALGSHLNARKRFGILRHSRGSGPGLKDTKVSELQTVIVTQLPRHLIEECLDNALDRHSFGLCLLCNPVDQFFLRNCCHRLPHFRKERLGNWILSLVAEAAA